jgi:desampylase
MSPKLTIAPDAYATMLAAAAAARPLEACGLLFGTGAHVARMQLTANVASDPAWHFEIDPAALIAAHRAMRDGIGLQLVGYFHSHPNGLARPSATDCEAAAHDGRVWIIVADDATTCWRDGPEGFEPLSYALSDG